MSSIFACRLDSDTEVLRWQHFVDDVCPFDDHDGVWVTDIFRKFVRHNAGVIQPIEIEVIQREFWTMVLPTNSERRARHMVVTAHAFCESANKGCLATTQITFKLDDLPTLKLFSDSVGELNGSFGVGGRCFPSHIGIHILRMLPQAHL